MATYETRFGIKGDSSNIYVLTSNSIDGLIEQFETLSSFIPKEKIIEKPNYSNKLYSSSQENLINNNTIDKLKSLYSNNK
tara:strand:+ start:778 stop:1017 length:240 start_codon:yes stop_codon:yes gene_type:complete